MRFSANRFFWMCSTALLAGTSSAALAQGAPPSSGDAPAAQSQRSGSPQLEDIVVTARRTSEALQTTPVAVTALSNEALQQRQVLQATDLQRAAPAVSIGTGGTGPASILYISIRGQAQNSPNSFSDNAVGIYIDGIYLGRAIGGNVGFLDLSSAEVLRGPQGTLFGRNTTGGALNITTNAPTQNFEGYIRVGAGNYDANLFEGVLNVPLTPELAVRFAGRYEDHKGYFPAPFLGTNLGSLDSSYLARGSIKWEPNSLPLTWTVSGDYTRQRGNGPPFVAAALNPASPLSYYYGLAQRQQANPGIIGQESDAILTGALGFAVPTADVRKFIPAGLTGPITQFGNAAFPNSGGLRSNNPLTTYQYNNFGRAELDMLGRLGDGTTGWSTTSNLAVDLGDLTVKSITGYRQSRSFNVFNISALPTAAGAGYSIYRNRQFSQELQLSGDFGAMSFITGLYYFREHGTESTLADTFEYTPIGTRIFNNANYVQQSKGMFFQANYNFTDRLRVTGGIRYTWDKRFINRHNTVNWNLPAAQQTCVVGPNAGIPNTGDDCNNPETVKFSYPAWTAGIDYRIGQDTFVYLKTSGASMSGGFNSRPVPPPYSTSFQPENVRDVEAGFKGEFLNRRLRTNLAAFYSWQSDVQRIVNAVVCNGTPPQCATTQFVNNAGKVHTYGVELETTLLPWRGMRIDASAAYLNAKYVSGTRFEDQLVNGAILSVDRSGEPVPYAPKWTAAFGATQDFDIGADTLSLHADYSYISSRYFDFFTTGDPAQAPSVAIANDASRIRAYGLVNAVATYSLKEQKFDVALWVKNLTDKAYFTNVFNSYTGLGVTAQNPGSPRTYGFTVTYRWN
jgi:iron complex outermembrane receptor protein